MEIRRKPSIDVVKNGGHIRKMGVLRFPTFCAFITFFEGKK